MTLPRALSSLAVSMLLAGTASAQAVPPAGAVDSALYKDLRYRMVGPSRGGRVTAYAGHRRQPGTFYIGATGGGVWKTTDYGVTWAPISDGFFATGSIGAIAVAESDPNVVYVGTGSAGIRSNVIQGRGVYKSTDAGKTWSFVGLRDVGQIGDALVHPQNPDVAYVAALGQPFGPNPERGVFRTSDGGKSWKKVLFINDRTGAVKLSINPQDPREIYAAAWRGERKPWTIISGGPASETGLYKTTDGGETWTHLTRGLPQTLIGKIDVDVSPANPRRVYVLLEAPGEERGVYRSDDAGQSFQHVNSELDPIRRPFYYTHLTAHPKDADTVFINNERFFKSTDGGKSFRTVQTPHGDNHGMWINPDNPDLFLQVNDGGANVTSNGGQTWSSQNNQPTAELYQVEVDDQFPYRIYGAQQDTGSPVIVPSLPPMARPYIDPLQLWLVGPGCETGPVKPTPGNPNLLYGVCKGEFYRMNLLTGQEQGYWIYPQQRYGHAARDMRYRFQRVSPFEVSPHDPNVIYHGSQYLHRTADGGRTWQTISPDLTANEPDKQGTSGEPITRDITGEEVYSTLYAIDESPLEKGVIWTGSNDGPIHVTRDGGKTWGNVTPKGLPPGGRVQNIEASPHRKGGAYVALYRYLLNDWQPYIYKTDDYGLTWKRLTDGKNGIPADYPTRVVREDPDQAGLLYAGTEFGMFVSFDDGKRWQSFQQNLPVTPVTDIKVHRKDLVLSTMGRSFWVLDNVKPLQEIAQGLAGGATAATGLFTPREAYRVRYTPMGGSDPAEPNYPPAGAHIDYYLASEPQGEVKLEILDASGKLVRSFSSEAPARQTGASTSATTGMTEEGGRFGQRALPSRLQKTAGMHRFVWDLRMGGGDAGRGGAAPLVLPGTYQVKFSAAATNETKPLVVKLDPRLALDGITLADLQEQQALQLKLAEGMAAGRRAAARLREAREKLRADAELVRRLQALEARLVTGGGSYPQPMLIDQFANVARMLGQADQKVGKDAFLRYDDLKEQLDALLAEIERTLSAAAGSN
jgi:photosystem II stability/assembly factor-like uncharacterized protein